jgi:outer membrane protein assembly factor BamB
VLTKNHVVKSWLHGGDSWIAGFDKATGEIDWKVPRNYDVPNENDQVYTTPLVYEQNGNERLLIWGADHLTAHDAANGKLLWSCGGFNPDGTGFWPPIATPVIVEDLVVVPVGRDDKRQGRLHGIRLGGEGDVSGTHRAWTREDVGIFVPTPVEYKGRVYLVRHRGQVVCLHPAEGKTVWNAQLPQGSADYYSSPLIANGKFYIAREDGMVFVANVENGFELLAENDMGERIIASPVPVSNRLLFRGDDHLFCVQAE